MKKIGVVILLLVFSFGYSIAQNKSVKAGAAQYVPISIQFGGFVNPVSDDLKFLPELTNLRVSKNESNEQEKLEELKAEKMKAKIKYLVEKKILSKSAEEAKSNEPILLSGFNTITNDGCPSDNTLAINRNNQIVTVVNSHVRYYSTSGTGLQAKMSLITFFNSVLSSSNSLCDPKVIYDNQANRFILYCQTCNSSPVPSSLCVAFSKTDDPTQGWWIYKFSGSPSSVNNGNCWVDYPKLAVSDHDLFITSNMFDGSGNYLESVIYQLDKTIGFAGSTYGSSDALLWSNISGSPFTMVPISNGINGGYGNMMYLISTDNSGSSSSNLLLFKINNAVNNTPSMTLDYVSIPTYSQPSDGIQKGTSVKLMTGDFRAMDGFYLNGTIHFVFHCDAGSNFTTINYSRIAYNGSSWMAQNKIIGAPNTDYSYPGIASAGYNNNDQSSVICFNYSSINDYPSCAAVFIDNNFNVSNPVTIQAGSGYVNAYAQSIGGGMQGNRWGDYSAAARDYSSNPPTIYCYNTYGNNSADWVNYVSALKSVASAPNGIESAQAIEPKLLVFPNPIVDIFLIKFTAEKNEMVTINLYDVQGKLVKEIYKADCLQGENLFTFNKGALGAGSYLLEIVLGNKIVKTEKIILLEK